MEKFIKNNLIISVIIVSITLFIIATITMKKNNKKSYLITTLLFLLGLAGYYPENNTALEAVNKSFKQIEKSAKMNNVLRTQAWRNFKRFWKKLDAIKPTRKKSIFGEYAGAIKNNDIILYKKQLNDVIKQLTLANHLSPFEIKIFNAVCKERIYYMSVGKRSMTSRMIAPLTIRTIENSIQSLERRIDILLKLNDNKKITHSQFKMALSKINENIQEFAISKIIKENYIASMLHPRLSLPFKNKSINRVEVLLQQFEAHYSDYKTKKAKGVIRKEHLKYYKNIEQKYKTTKRKLQKMNELLPSLNLLIKDLVQ